MDGHLTDCSESSHRRFYILPFSSARCVDQKEGELKLKVLPLIISRVSFRTFYRNAGHCLKTFFAG